MPEFSEPEFLEPESLGPESLGSESSGRDPGADLDLAALFADDAPAAHDAEFVTAVMKRAANRRLAVELIWAGLAAALSALVLWALGPVLGPVLKPFAATAVIVAPIAVLVGSVLFLVHPRTSPI